jgi:hypothetical protein
MYFGRLLFPKKCPNIFEPRSTIFELARGALSLFRGPDANRARRGPRFRRGSPPRCRVLRGVSFVHVGKKKAISIRLSRAELSSLAQLPWPPPPPPQQQRLPSQADGGARPARVPPPFPHAPRCPADAASSLLVRALLPSSLACLLNHPRFVSDGRIHGGRERALTRPVLLDRRFVRVWREIGVVAMRGI